MTFPIVRECSDFLPSMGFSVTVVFESMCEREMADGPYHGGSWRSPKSALISWLQRLSSLAYRQVRSVAQGKPYEGTVFLSAR